MWVMHDGPYNEHLVRDFGAMNLALAAVTLAALYYGSRAAARAAAIGWLVFSIPHAVYHFRHLSHYETADKIGNVVSLSFAVLLAIAALVALARPPARAAVRVRTMGVVVNPYLNRRLQEFGTTIFAEMSALAVATGSINLGQGFPDTDGPDVVKRAAIDGDRSGPQPVPARASASRCCGDAIAAHQARFYGLTYDPDTEVLVTAGATEAIAAAILALCEPDDEVVTFEPYYDSYAACIAMAGARAHGRDAARARLRLRPRRAAAGDHAAHEARVAELAPQPDRARCSPAPSSSSIAELAIAHDLLVVTDEVYEHLVYDGEHVPIATLPGMRDRTVTISSGGKTFSFTGWKIGWICATPPLTDAVKTAKQFLTYVNGGPFQYAIATGLDLGDDYYAGFLAGMRDRRDRLVRGAGGRGIRRLRAAGHVLRHHRHPAARRRRRHRVLPVAAGTVRGGRGAERRVLRRQGGRRAARAVGVLQAARGARRSRRPPEGARP